MKSNLTFSFLALSVLIFCVKANAQWTILPSNTTSIFNQMSFPSNDTGYLITNKVFRTNNGGTSFDSLQVPNCAQYNNIYFRTQLDGAICGYRTSSGPLISRTIDGGNTWTEITPAVSVGSAMSVKFQSVTNGTYISSAPGFYRTFNGGLSWDTITFGYDYFNTMDFPDSQTGYIAGFDGTFAYHGIICKTTDGGTTWNLLNTFTQWNTDIQQIQFVSVDSGFASFVTFPTQSKLIRTRNGGTSWDTVLFSQGQIVRFAFSNYSNGFIVNDSGSIYRTNDAGLTWVLDRLHTTTLNDICVTPAYAYAAGSVGLVIKRNLVLEIPELSNENQFKIYPNPASDYTMIKSSLAGKIESISAFDLSGRKCENLSWKYSGNGELILETGSFSPGMYILQLKGKDFSYSIHLNKL
jgi:photosystem II stability/assembly factor-like uncharacterized protein